MMCTENKPLTNTEFKKVNNKAYDKPFEVSDRDSISIRVPTKGKFAWQFRYIFNNKAERLTLGHYPNLSLDYVRKQLSRLQGFIFDGKPLKEYGKNKKNKNILDAIH